MLFLSLFIIQFWVCWLADFGCLASSIVSFGWWCKMSPHVGRVTAIWKLSMTESSLACLAALCLLSSLLFFQEQIWCHVFTGYITIKLNTTNTILWRKSIFKIVPWKISYLNFLLPTSSTYSSVTGTFLLYSIFTINEFNLILCSFLILDRLHIIYRFIH